MSESMLRVAEGTLRALIEDAIQSGDELSEEEIRYIARERENIRLARAAMA